MKNKILITTALLFASLCNAQSHYKIAGKIQLEGNSFWDYITVDDATNHLYVSHGTMVQVVDLNTSKLLGTIPNTNGVHGIALADDLNKGFISDGRDAQVTVIDLSKLTTITTIKVTGKNPDAIVYDAVSQRVFTFNGRSNNSTVIDAKTNKVIGTIDLPGRPEFAVADGRGKIFFNLEDKSKICRIDTKAMKVEVTWDLAPGEGPSGLAMDRKNRRLFSVCDNKMMVIMNADNGKIITTIPTGEHTDGAAFDSVKMIAYSSNGEGTLTAVKEESPDKFKLYENVPTQLGARTCTVNSKTHRIYLPTAEFGPRPAPTKEHPHQRPTLKPGSFVVLDIVEVK